MTTKIPGIPKPPSKLDIETKRYLETLAEVIEIRLGRKGDILDRAVTVRELIESGLAESRKTVLRFDTDNISDTTVGISNPSFTADTPVVPTGFTASGAFENIILGWDRPLYHGHSHTEIFSHTSDSIGSATLLGIAVGTTYIDPVGGGGVSKYFWIRHVSTTDERGNFNSSAGTLATTATNATAILSELTNSISVNQLTTSLQNQIDGSGSALDLANLENFTGFISTYDISTAGSLLTRLGATENVANGLVTTFGSTTAAANSATQAATSAAAAASSEADAIQAEADAIIAQAAAELAATNAGTAQTAAIAAQAGAETAEGNAETAETNAQTAQSAAETAQTAASTSATSAAGSASSASTSATAAATSATAA